MPPVIRPNIRPMPQRAKPLAPRSPTEKFGHSVAPKTNDHWEPTVEMRWFVGPPREVTYGNSGIKEMAAPTPKLQQRWKCVQHSQSRVRPVELYYEWWDIPVVTEEPKKDK